MGKYSTQAAQYSSNANSISELLNNISGTIDNINNTLSPSEDGMITTTIKIGNNIKKEIESIISKMNSISSSVSYEAGRLDAILEEEMKKKLLVSETTTDETDTISE